MSIINIKALFIVRHYAPTSPELLTARDEYSIDENPEGWEAECDRVLKDVGSSEILSQGIFTISLDEDDLMKQLLPTGHLTGTVGRMSEA